MFALSCGSKPPGRVIARVPNQQHVAPSHPFVLDVRPLRHLPGRFTYSVGCNGETRVSFLHTYPSFEEAWRAGKAALKAVTAKWERGALDQQSA